MGYIYGIGIAIVMVAFLVGNRTFISFILGAVTSILTVLAVYAAFLFDTTHLMFWIVVGCLTFMAMYYYWFLYTLLFFVFFAVSLLIAERGQFFLTGQLSIDGLIKSLIMTVIACLTAMLFYKLHKSHRMKELFEKQKDYFHNIRQFRKKSKSDFQRMPYKKQEVHEKTETISEMERWRLLYASRSKTEATADFKKQESSAASSTNKRKEENFTWNNQSQERERKRDSAHREEQTGEHTYTKSGRYSDTTRNNTQSPWKYFADCKTVSDAKRRRVELSKIFHPDANGYCEEMAEINAEFDKFKRCHPD